MYIQSQVSSAWISESEIFATEVLTLILIMKIVRKKLQSAGRLGDNQQKITRY